MTTALVKSRRMEGGLSRVQQSMLKYTASSHADNDGLDNFGGV